MLINLSKIMVVKVQYYWFIDLCIVYLSIV